jgi:hypothetical protein
MKMNYEELMMFYKTQIAPYGVSADREDVEFFREEYERITGTKCTFC